MHTDDSKLLFPEESKAILGCAMEVLNILGHGLYEKPYENSLVAEFTRRDIPYDQQKRYEIVYKGTKVGEYIPDLIAFDRLIVDAKVVDRIGNHEIGQMMNYLRITGHRVGLILNFKRRKLEWKRVAV